MSGQDLFVQKNRRGRPKGKVRPPTVALRLPLDAVEAVDAWIAAQPEPRPSRSEIIRRLLVEALAKPVDAGSTAAEDLKRAAMSESNADRLSPKDQTEGNPR
jgi:Arc/MetJ-type ribon-helix-helix transcriptional regulator